MQSATFATQREAKAWGAATEAKIREGHFFKEHALGKRTLAEHFPGTAGTAGSPYAKQFGKNQKLLIDRYVHTVLPSKWNARNQGLQLAWWRARLGHLPLITITRATIAECHDELEAETVRGGERRAPATVVRYLAALSHVYSVAMRDWGWIESNPVRLERKPREPRGRVRLLDEGERCAFLQRVANPAAATCTPSSCSPSRLECAAAK